MRFSCCSVRISKCKCNKFQNPEFGIAFTPYSPYYIIKGVIKKNQYSMYLWERARSKTTDWKILAMLPSMLKIVNQQCLKRDLRSCDISILGGTSSSAGQGAEQSAVSWPCFEQWWDQMTSRSPLQSILFDDSVISSVFSLSWLDYWRTVCRAWRDHREWPKGHGGVWRGWCHVSVPGFSWKRKGRWMEATGCCSAK